MRVGAPAAGLLAVALSAGVASAQSTPEICARSDDFAAVESACTTVIVQRSAAGGEGPVWAYTNRCRARHRLGRPQEALSDCDRAVELDPRSHLATHSRAIVLHRLGRHVRALDDVDRAIKLGPGDHSAFETRGSILCALGRPEHTLRSYRRAIEHGAFRSYVWQGHLRQSGHYQGALDGRFGARSWAALQAWVGENCR